MSSDDILLSVRFTKRGEEREVGLQSLVRCLNLLDSSLNIDANDAREPGLVTFVSGVGLAKAGTLVELSLLKSSACNSNSFCYLKKIWYIDSPQSTDASR